MRRPLRKALSTRTSSGKSGFAAPQATEIPQTHDEAAEEIDPNAVRGGGGTDVRERLSSLRSRGLPARFMAQGIGHVVGQHVAEPLAKA